MVKINLVGGFLAYPSEKWWSESQFGWLFIPNWMEEYKKCSKPPIRWGPQNT